MPKNLKFASERRSDQRKKVIQAEMLQAQTFIQMHLPLSSLLEAYQQQQHFVMLQTLEDAIEHEASSIHSKKMLYHCYRKHIMLFNQRYDLELDLPCKQLLSIEREALEFDREWLQRSSYASGIHHQICRYWNTAQHFSDEEFIGNVLISSILFAGVSTPNTLDALLEQLKEGLNIQYLKALDLQLLFLTPLSPGYGDLYDHNAPLRKSRTLVLDRITQLWLARYLIKSPPVRMNAFDYLRVIFKKMGFTGQYSEISRLLDSASCHWMQLPGVAMDPALSRCLEDKNQTCGLSLASFKNSLNPPLLSGPLTNDTPAKKVAVQSNHRILNEASVASIKKLHKYLLKTLRQSKACLTELISYVEQEQTQLTEPSLRICLWLISLFQPSTAQVQHLSELFDLDADAWLKYLSHQQKLKRSSIYSYYAKFAEAWLFFSYAHIEDPDFNVHLEDIYHKILGEQRKSSHQQLDLLRRFHHFQKKLFKAEDFPVYSDIQMSSHPRTEIPSAQTLCAVLDLLPAQAAHNHLNQQDAGMFRIILILAFRTGMRINEILGLRIKDIEGPACTSLWIRPYRSGQREHTLKTDSAERNLPVQILLRPDEHAVFRDYCLGKRISSAKDDYLFSVWNSDQRIPSHVVAQVFSDLVHAVLPGNRYSFHSLRHSAANHLALALMMPYAVVKVFSDYSEQDYQRIRTALIRSSAAQDRWYVLAHLLGHITPKETFKSYLHLCFIMAGYHLMQYDPLIPVQTIQSIYPDLEIKTRSEEIHLSRLSHQLRLNLDIVALTDARASRKKSRTLKKSAVREPDSGNQSYYPGTDHSNIPVNTLTKMIRHCERFQDTDYIAKKLNLPPGLIQECQDNICKLQMLRNQKGKYRFVLHSEKSNRILPYVETYEERQLIAYVFKQLGPYKKNNPKLIKALKIFMDKVNPSESGLIFHINDIEQLNLFLEMIYPLIPPQYWACSIDQNIDRNMIKQSIWINKIAHLNYGNFNHAVRIYLKSEKTHKSLSLFKYIIIVLCILNKNLFI